MAVKGKRPRQYSLSLKVSEEKKTVFAQRCAAAGLSQSEMLDRSLFGRLPDEVPLPSVLRDQLALVHQLRAAIADGAPIDCEPLEGLVEATRVLISVVRQSLA